MSIDRQDDAKKRAEQAEYRMQLIEAELNAIRSSKAYQLSKKLGIIKAQIQSDPVGLSKKAAKILLTNPRKARHLFRSASRGAFIAQSVAEQTAKYQEWILLNEPDEDELDVQRTAAEKLQYKPVFSIITPVFNPPADVFEELIESVLDQTYPYFELCLGDFGDSPAVTAILERYAALDNRVRYKKFSENKGIAFNSNQVLTMATGEYIALLDHDDTLALNALFENARLLNEKRYDFIYSDKDKIDEAGNRFDPLFKAELSPEMMLNVNYFTHLNIMRTELVRQIGGWDQATDGAQDWDLFLRVIAAGDGVGYIPKVLYHWRVIESSTAHSIETKPYALAGQRKAVDKYLQTLGVAATTYHQKTELFIKWDAAALDSKPLVFIWHSNTGNSQRLMRQVTRTLPAAEFVLLAADKTAQEAKELARHTGTRVMPYAANLGAALDDFLQTVRDDRVCLFLLDTVHLPKRGVWYEDLTGWLAIEGVGAVAGRLVDKKDLIVSSGGVITPAGEYSPLFYRYPRYYQSYVGNAEWVRNLQVIAPYVAATTLQQLKSFPFKDFSLPARELFDEFFLALSRRSRLVMTPHVTATVRTSLELEAVHPVGSLKKYAKSRDYHDPFSNPNVSPTDPMRLFADEDLPGMPAVSEAPTIDSYQHDAIILADTFDISQAEIERCLAAQQRPVAQAPKSVAWVLPAFNAVYAGLMNIFSFADYLCVDQGLATTFYILKATDDVTVERGAVTAAFPDLKKASFVAIRPAEAAKIKPHDFGIATQWATVYPLAKATGIGHRFYFIQDNEVNFYPKGSVSALVEQTYQLGFTAIAGTEGLLDMYRRQYGGDGVVLQSKVDLSAYRPRKDKYYAPAKPYKVFFYARPNMPRNAFELGVAGLKRLKQDLGADVEIITAGAAWDPDAYGVGGMFTNLGKIAYEAVPKLYRSVDAGLMFMFSGHPGVTASELMASGCPVVVNEYDDVTWHELYVHEQTCLVTKATASEVAHNLRRCLTEQPLRHVLIDGGLKKAHGFYSGYGVSRATAFIGMCGSPTKKHS